MNTFTKQLTAAPGGTIYLAPEDGVISLSVQASPAGGSFNFTGSYTFKGIVPGTLVLTDGQGVSLTAPSTSQTLSGITIEWVSGTVEVMISVS